MLRKPVPAGRNPAIIATLDLFRDKLEGLGGGLGVTQSFSGEPMIDRVN